MFTIFGLWRKIVDFYATQNRKMAMNMPQTFHIIMVDKYNIFSGIFSTTGTKSATQLNCNSQVCNSLVTMCILNCKLQTISLLSETNLVTVDDHAISFRFHCYFF